MMRKLFLTALAAFAAVSLVGMVGVQKASAAENHERMEQLGDTIVSHIRVLQAEQLGEASSSLVPSSTAPALPLDAVEELLTLSRSANSGFMEPIAYSAELNGEPEILETTVAGTLRVRYMIYLATTYEFTDGSGEKVTTKEVHPYIATIDPAGQVTSFEDECGLLGICTEERGDRVLESSPAEDTAPGDDVIGQPLSGLGPVRPMGEWDPAKEKVDRVLRYATEWQNKRNPAFVSFSQDCANFASQALLHGGWRMIDGPKEAVRTWAANSSQASWSWAGAQNFYNHLKVTARGRDLSRVSELVPTDVLFVRFPGDTDIGHTTIVTKTYNGVPFLTYHSTDTLNISFTDFVRRNNSNNGGRTSQYLPVRTDLNVIAMP